MVLSDVRKAIEDVLGVCDCVDRYALGRSNDGCSDWTYAALCRHPNQLSAIQANRGVITTIICN